MNNTANFHALPAGYELRFNSLFNEGHGLSFPCDATGQVTLDDLTPSALRNYFYARTTIGRDFAMPRVCRA